MTDYDKLTVVKLREELVKRGLPKSGLKAVLVNRLTEADAQAGHDAQVASHSQEPEGRTQNDQTEEVETREAPPAVQGQIIVKGDGEIGSDAPQASAAKENDIVDPTAAHRQGESITELEVIVEIEEKGKGTTGTVAQNEEVVPQVPNHEAVSPVSDSKPSADIPPEDPPPIKADTAQLEVIESPSDEEVSNQQVVEKPLPAANSTQLITADSTQSSLSRQELQEDSNKRKRRSQSPPPSSIETALKRARADDGRPHVKLPEEDENKKASYDEVNQPEAEMEDAPPTDVPNNMTTNGHTHPRVAVEKNDDASVTEGYQSQPQSDQKEVPAHSTMAESPSKPSPQDARFKNLFTASSKRQGSPPHHSLDVDNDRAVTPAIHPATSALYIGEMARPLQIGSFKDHLVALASPPGSAPDTEIITDFYLDPIRTHCLVGFTNTSAAARVRSGLHNRLWPDDRLRKPLWVDFVPQEKLKKWIEVESEASTTRGQPPKRWEVVYEEEKDGLKAYLQEAGSNGGAPRPDPFLSSIPEAGRGVHGAPSGPRNLDAKPRVSQSSSTSKPDNGSGFQALDDLFQSTAAKPKLYYLPATNGVVDRRLNTLAAGRGGGRGDEMRRYTFEEDTIVDRGPEFGARGRGGYGGRGGGYGGGYRGWRGDRRDRR